MIKHKIISILSNLVIPGLGLIYIKRIKSGLTIFLLSLLLAIVLWTVLIFTNISIIIYLIIIILWYIGINILTIKSINNVINDIKTLKWYIVLIYFVIASFVLIPISQNLINKYYFQTFQIRTSNMSPTLKIGDRIIAAKIFNKNKINRFDIITFTKKDDPIYYVSRIIGLPGEEIEIIDNEVYINGKLIIESHKLLENPNNYNDDIINKLSNLKKIDTPENKIFVLGDNRYNSHDSRYFGFIDLENIDKKIYKIYFSNEFKRIGKEL